MTSSATPSLGTRMAEFVDPYTYPGTTVLRNLLGITDRAALAIAEPDITWGRRQQLATGAVTGAFDFPHLCAIHHWLFQDVYEWAGRTRTVNISKGTSHFLPAPSIRTGADYTFSSDAAAALRSGPLSDEEFLRNATELLASVNYIHPFRDGNGRTQRAFLDALAAHGARELAWRNVAGAENITASAASVDDPDSPLLRQLVEKVMRPPADGLSLLDPGVYRTAAPSSSTSREDDGLSHLGRYRS